ncbi:MAG: hypothetical protein OER86_07625 [Phycisphaerae bacterium]|nr:hypothetical protein [Phycisphaerae bacterium]
MKRILSAVLVSIGLLVGCDFTVPLVNRPSIRVDNSVLGLWERPKRDGTTEQLLVLAFSPNEYLVSYPAGSKQAMFARATAARVGERTLIQLQWVGTVEGGLPGDKRVYQYASYEVAEGTLRLRLINPDVIGRDVATTRELAENIAALADHPQFFRPAMSFSKVSR